MRRFACVLAAFAAMFAPLAASGQTGAENEIVVPGERIPEMVQSFVGEVAAANREERQMSRWDRRICPRVAGLDATRGQYVIDRIAVRAAALDLRTGEPDCAPNMMVFFTDDSDRLARELAETYRPYMLTADGSGGTPGAEALEAFASAPRAVRWWHVSRTFSKDGEAIGLTGTDRASMIRQQSRTGYNIGQNGASFSTFSPSRVRSATRQDLSHAVVVVDVRRAEGVRFAALADYLAMVSLAQLAPDAAPREAPTILSLFEGERRSADAPQTLTEWDLAYLEGLYGARRAAPNEAWQRRDIQNHMEEVLTPDAGD